MSAQFSRDHCKIAVGKILQTIGWHSINSTPLEVLTDILSKYIQQISKITNDYSNEFGQTEANLDHVGLAFQEMGINLPELEEYVTYVNFGPGPHPVPKFPIPKENHLNFLKPGSKEVVTRPVHIHEHLPPMYPLMEGSENEAENITVKQEIEDDLNSETSQQFKKPADISPEFRRPKREDESSRPTREISSVMMTTSGFLSPAREGKLPEAKAPLPPPVAEVIPPAPHPGDPNFKKKPEKRKEKFGKELFKPLAEEKLAKKVPSMKNLVKMKQKSAAAAAAANASAVLNPSSSAFPTNYMSNSAVINASVTPNVPAVIMAGGGNAASHVANPSSIIPPTHFLHLNDMKPNIMPNPHRMFKENLDRALAAAKAKTEKLNTTITPIPMKSASPSSQMMIQQVEKLFNEPDKKKINILKKISVKDGKTKKDSRASTPNLIIDQPCDIVSKISHLSSDITIEPIPRAKSPEKIDSFFDDGSPPGTPPTPRTPEILAHSPPIQKEKRKRKDTRKVKRPRKNQHRYLETDLVDIIMERPKTPEAHIFSHLRQTPPAHMGLPSMHPPHLPYPFLTNFGGPGLIPPQLNTPMFHFSQLSNIPNFGKNPYFPSVVHNMPPQMEPVPLISPKIKESPVEIKPVEIKPVEIKPAEVKPVETKPVEIKPAEIIPQPVIQPQPPPQPIQVPETSSSTAPAIPKSTETIKKVKEHKKEKKDKIKKKNKKDKVKEKSEKKKLKGLKKDNKEKVRKEKKIKKKEKLVKEPENPIPKILLKVNSPSPRPETPESIRKLNIKPIVKKDEELTIEERKREPSPGGVGGGLAKISALVTGPPKQKSNLSPVVPPPVEKLVPEEPAQVPAPRTPGRPRLHPLKPKLPPKPKKLEQTFKKMDEQGNEVWICPACGQQDDGRPMIGCDGCDAWYHWVCVGIQVPPDENENWYCKPCLCRKNEDFQSDKKRKRKRKEKKEH